jgi:hypothetical protein
MSFIGNAISSAFTAPGTAAATNQANEEENAAGYAAGLIPGAAKTLGQEQGWFNQQLPTLEAGVNTLGYDTTQAGRNNESNLINQQLQSQARSNAGAMPAQFAGNPSLAQAFTLGGYGAANQNAASATAQLNSPAGIGSAVGTYENAANALPSGPNYSSMSPLYSDVYGQMKQPVGEGLGQILGSLAGPLLSGGIGSLLGGGSSGGSSGGGGYGGFGNYSTSPAGYSSVGAIPGAVGDTPVVGAGGYSGYLPTPATDFGSYWAVP